MTADYSFDRLLARFPYVAGAAYFVLVVAFVVTIWITLANILEERATLASSVDILNQLEARRQITDTATMAAGAVPAGSRSQRRNDHGRRRGALAAGRRCHHASWRQRAVFTGGCARDRNPKMAS